MATQMIVTTIEDRETTYHNNLVTQGAIKEIRNINGVNVYALTSSFSNNHVNQETQKKGIVLHFTEGMLHGDLPLLANLQTGDRYHVSVPYVIARNGNVYELFDPKYWGYHLTIGEHAPQWQTIPIEIVNMGRLTKHGSYLKHRYGGWYTDIYCNHSPEHGRFWRQASSFRGYEYWADFTDAQYTSLRALLKYLCDRFDIPWHFLSPQTKFKKFPSIAEASRFRGIASHANYYHGAGSGVKTDIGPGFDWWQLSSSLPVKVSGSSSKEPYRPTKENIAAYYKHTEVDHTSGYFPLGANTVWHGGVHIRASKGTPVVAWAPGKIIAARLPEDKEQAYGHFGSRSFILMQHTLRGKTVFSLYMHLNNEPFEITDSDEGPRFAGKSKKLNDFRWLFRNEDSQEGESVSVIDMDMVEKLRSGEVVSVDKVIAPGEPVWTIGEYRERKGDLASMLHWEIFSEENIYAEEEGWTQAEDSDDKDFNADSQDIASTLNLIDLNSDGKISREELNTFFSAQGKEVVDLRRKACRFHSEWDVNLPEAVSALDENWWSTLFLESRLGPYMWWKDAPGEVKSKLPFSMVWHYNPIAVIEEENRSYEAGDDA